MQQKIIRKTLQKFQDGYTKRDISQLDDFMNLFADANDIELIGIGASVRGGDEWFEGKEAIREIIESDWTYWGEVKIDVPSAKITIHGDVAWVSTTGVLVQTDTFEKALPFYVKQMTELLEDAAKTPVDKLMEASYFGMSRLRERQKGVGFEWALVLTLVLIQVESEWRFHTIHWAMPT